MPHLPDRSDFEAAYAGQAPWDIDGQQLDFVKWADRITGSILDVGCGTGEHALYFAQRGNRVKGIDFLAEPIDRARKKAAEWGIAVTFIVMDALVLKELPQMFDNAIDSGLFHVFSDEDRQTYVEGLGSVIKKGGRLFMLCFCDEEPGTQGPRRISKRELEAAFANGWKIESIEPTRFEIHPSASFLGFSEGGPMAWAVVVQRV